MGNKVIFIIACSPLLDIISNYHTRTNPPKWKERLIISNTITLHYIILQKNIYKIVNTNKSTNKINQRSIYFNDIIEHERNEWNLNISNLNFSLRK